jgi:hypothetical protein
MVMKKILDNMDVKPIYDEIDKSLWSPCSAQTNPNLPKGHAIFFSGSSFQTILNLVELEKIDGKREEIVPKDLQDIILTDFVPTEIYFKYPNLNKFFLWFVETYGGKVARAIIYNTPTKGGVLKHRDALPDGQETVPRKIKLHGNKDRFHLVISGKYEYTVHGETQVFSKGELWWFDNKTFHSSYNHGDVPKINLVFDVADSMFGEI